MKTTWIVGLAAAAPCLAQQNPFANLGYTESMETWGARLPGCDARLGGVGVAGGDRALSGEGAGGAVVTNLGRMAAWCILSVLGHPKWKPRDNGSRSASLLEGNMKPFAGVQVWIVIVAILVTGPRTLSAGTNVWTSLGPEGGSIDRLVVDPQSPGTLYAVAGGGVFKTTNGGRTWSRLAISGLASARALAIDPQNPSTLYAVANARGLKSTDGGMSWSELNSLPARTNALAVDARSSTVYARTCAGVARSTDGGESWRETVFPPPFTCTPMLAIDPSTGALYTTRVVYTPDGIHGTDRTGRILKSADGGESWTVLELGVTSVAVKALAFDPQNSSTIYALAWGSLHLTDQQPRTWVFKTTDGGTSWVNSTVLDDGGGVVAVDPQNPSTVYAATRRAVLRSTDGGTRWNPIALEPADVSQWYWSPSSVSALAIAPPASPAAPPRSRAGASRRSSSTLYAGTYTRGALKSTDEGRTWTAVNSGLIATDVQSLLPDPQNPSTLYGVLGSVEIVKSSDGGTSWRSANSGLPADIWLGPLAIDPQDPATVYVATNWSGAFKTTDGGTSWKAANSGLPREVNGLAMDPQNSSTLYAGIGDEACWEYARCGSSGVFKSVDGGASWSDSGLSRYWVGRVVVDPQNSSAIYATGFLPRLAGGASAAWGWGSPAFFKSTNGGRSWEVLNLPMPSIAGLAIDPQEPGTAYAYGESLLKTTDGGKSWNAVDLAIRTLAIDPQTPSTLYAGTDGGVFRSTDGGASWTAVNSGLTSLGIDTLAIDPRNPNTVFAGTSGGGVFSITFTSQKQ